MAELGGIEKILALLSPTLDASPGKDTIEDKIDNFIFDPHSPTAPLDLIPGLGGGAQAIDSVFGAFGKIKGIMDKGFEIAKIGRKSRSKPLTAGLSKTDELVKSVARGRKVGAPLEGKSGEALAGFAHDQGGASIEAISRRAEFWKISRSGKLTPIVQGGEDAAMSAGQNAIVRMTPDGNAVIEGGALANKGMIDAFKTIPDFGAQKLQRVREVADATTHFLADDGADVADFLKKLGVEGFGQ